MEQASSPGAVRASLRSWRRRGEALAAERDPLVVAAVNAGLIKEEVHLLTGLGRSTIDRILARRSDEDGAASGRD